MAATAVGLLLGNLLPAGEFCWQALVIMLVVGIAMAKWKLPVPGTIALAAALGLIL